MDVENIVVGNRISIELSVPLSGRLRVLYSVGKPVCLAEHTSVTFS
jgi:hypothetical protein